MEGEEMEGGETEAGEGGFRGGRGKERTNEMKGGGTKTT